MVLLARVVALLLVFGQCAGRTEGTQDDGPPLVEDVDDNEPSATFENKITEYCPHGTVYRDGCSLCYCIEEEDEKTTIHCRSEVTDEECDRAARPCDGDVEVDTGMMLYNYRKECEGECSCEAENNVTVCQKLPCDDNLLWYHGYYNPPMQKYLNEVTDECPHGTIFRAGCSLCFCIIGIGDDVLLQCATSLEEEECASVADTAHCEPERLLYDYKKECEGECWCNEEKNITTCEHLPCDDNLLWFYGYYDQPGRHNVSIDDPSPDTRVGTNETETNKWLGRTGMGKPTVVSVRPNVRTKACPYGNVYRRNLDLCYCIEEVPGFVRVKCDLKYSEDELFAATQDGDCLPELLGDFSRECEGECNCTEAGQYIVCESLPCHDPVIWFHDLDKATENGHQPDDGSIHEWTDNRTDEGWHQVTSIPGEVVTSWRANNHHEQTEGECDFEDSSDSSETKDENAGPIGPDQENKNIDTPIGTKDNYGTGNYPGTDEDTTSIGNGDINAPGDNPSTDEDTPTGNEDVNEPGDNPSTDEDTPTGNEDVNEPGDNSSTDEDTLTGNEDINEHVDNPRADEENNPTGNEDKPDPDEENNPTGNEDKPDLDEENSPTGNEDINEAGDKPDPDEENNPCGNEDKPDLDEEHNPTGNEYNNESGDKPDLDEENNPTGNEGINEAGDKPDLDEENNPTGNEDINEAGDKPDPYEENNPTGNEDINEAGDKPDPGEKNSPSGSDGTGEKRDPTCQT